MKQAASGPGATKVSPALYLGDCLDVLPRIDEEITCVVMDPPYCSGGFTEVARKQARGMGLRSETRRSIGWFEGDNMTSAGLAWLLREVAAQSARMLTKGGTVSVFTDWRMVPQLAPAIESTRLRFQNLIIWNKGTFGLGNGFRSQHELVMHFAKGAPTYHDASVGNVITASRPSSVHRHHPTEKPVELLKQLIRVTSPPDGVVLDPFMGSGSTGVACAMLGRRFIGIEVDRAFFDIACRRIEEASRQANFALKPGAPSPGLFRSEPPELPLSTRAGNTRESSVQLLNKGECDD